MYHPIPRPWLLATNKIEVALGNVHVQKQGGSYRTQPEDRRGDFDISVDIAALQGGKDAEGYRQCRLRVMMLQRQPNATGVEPDRPAGEFSRLLCDDGCSASRRDAAGTIRTAVGLTGGPQLAWMLDRVCRKKAVQRQELNSGRTLPYEALTPEPGCTSVGESNS